MSARESLADAVPAARAHRGVPSDSPMRAPASTTRVGCAIYSTEWDYLICRYTPPGNVDGKPVFVAATKPALATATLASR